MDKYILTVLEECKGMRLDSYICLQLKDITRSHAANLILDGMVKKDGKSLIKSYKVTPGDEIEVTIPEPAETELVAQDIPLDIVYEDNSLLVINKPQGMVVHPAAGNYSGTLVNALLCHCEGNLSGINGVLRPGIVHRLDKDTSGLLMVAKNNKAHLSLSNQLKDRSLKRVYLALAHGKIKSDSGIIEAPIGRSSKDRKKMAVTKKNSRNAITQYRVIERFDKYSLVECSLKTGRTHQIRVHLSNIGHSIVADKTYGNKNDKFGLKGQLLHAYKIRFIHPDTQKEMEFTAPLPDYFKQVLKKLNSDFLSEIDN